MELSASEIPIRRGSRHRPSSPKMLGQLRHLSPMTLGPIP